MFLGVIKLPKYYIQVSRVPKLIPSLVRPAASLARAVNSVYTEWLFWSAPCILCQRNVDHGGETAGE